MSRKPRVITETGIYHIILRGNNQRDLFYDDKDRYFFLNRIKKYSKELKIDIFTYCLMSNHIHLLIKTDKYLSLFIQKLANSYVYYFNRKYECSGHLFQSRFKSEPVENDQYFKTVFRYILQNPTKSRLLDFKNYKWSNYKAITEQIDDGITNMEVLNRIFSDEINIHNFIQQVETLNCMEYENKYFLSDSKCVDQILKIFNIEKPFTFRNIELNDKKEKLRILKNKGYSINQISRITGISKYIIRTA